MQSLDESAVRIKEERFGDRGVVVVSRTDSRFVVVDSAGGNLETLSQTYVQE